MKHVLTAGFIIIVVVSILAFFLINRGRSGLLVSPVGENIKTLLEKPLDRYSFEKLREKKFIGSKITLGKKIKDESSYQSFIYYFTIGGKKVSGLLNTPQKPGIYPVIVMFRGFVPKENYTTGEGTRHSGEVFAQNGFITLAPDFLGFGESDKPSEKSIEERFQTYTTALGLLSSIGNLNKALESTNSAVVKADTSKVGIWGHSNGGHIALTVLEITGKSYPTVLWAPVSKPFPYSILYYTDEFDDHGKALRRVVADFEKDYDVEKYSLTNYFSWINAPIQLHQGGDDEAVPLRWSDQLITTLKELKKDITYFVYPGEDHNFSKGSWQTIVSRSIQFYQTHLR